MTNENPFMVETIAGVVDSTPAISVDPDLKMKQDFAEELLRDPMNPFKAAMKAFNGNVQLCTFAVANWQTDPIVVDHQTELMETHGIDSFLPNRHSIIHNAWNRAQDTRDNDEFVKLTELVAKLMGLIKKDGPVINNNVQLNVMEVPVVSSDKEWQEQATKHQNHLIEISLEQQAKDGSSD